MFHSDSLFDLSDFTHKDLFSKSLPVWSALDGLKSYMEGLQYPAIDRKLVPDAKPLPETVVFHNGDYFSAEECTIKYGDTTKGKLVVTQDGAVLEGSSVIMAGAVLMGDAILLGKGVLIETGALVKSPAVIDDCTEVRQGAYLRGYCLTGKRCVLGHTTEIKHSIFLNDAKAGHFAYLGDSILGTDANLGAGTKFANLKFLPGNVTIRYERQLVDTGRRKFGAILGDGSQTGCNSVTSPGTIFGKRCMLLPNTTAPAGYHPDKTFIR